MTAIANVRVRAAVPADLEHCASLFDLYRQFYGQPPDRELALKYLAARLQRRESSILVATRGPPELVGFTQLYPTFCSVAAAPIMVLYDLFVAPAARRFGIGRALLLAATARAAQAGAVRLELATAKTNDPARALYESLGWVRDDEFHRYTLAVRA